MATNSRGGSALPTTGDTALWLHNKLGTSNDLWSDNCSIISQLNVEVLRNIKICFVDLQVNVKLKLLLSFLHIPRRNLEEWKKELEDLLEIAVQDSDPWVLVTAEMLRHFPRKGTINFDFQSNNSSFFELVNDAKKLVKKHSDKRILPLESLFLNRNSFTTSFGQAPSLTKHFNLNRKAKSATLRAELLQKAQEAVSGKRTSTGPSVPIRCRGLNSDSTPLKGIPSRNHFNHSYSSFGKTSTLSRMSSGSNRASRIAAMTSSSGSGMKRDGGIVLLDIGEAPVANQRDLKRRKTKNADQLESSSATTTNPTPTTPTVSTPSAYSASSSMLSSSTSSTPVLGHKSHSDKAGGDNSPSISSKNSTANPMTVTASKSTPDYAAGLLGPNTSTPTKSNSQKPTGISLLLNNSTSSSLSTSHQTNSTPSQPPYMSSYQSSSNSSSILHSSLTNQPPTSQQSNNFLKQTTPSQPQQQTSNQYNYNQLQNNQMQNSNNFAPYQPSSSQQNFNYNQSTSTMNSGSQQQQQQNKPIPPPTNLQQQARLNYGQQQVNEQRVNPPATNQFGMFGQQQQQQQQQPNQQRTLPSPQIRPQFLRVINNMEFRQDVSSILAKANVLTQQERALVVNFINGISNNPCPNLGQVLSIKLSETIETRPQPNGSIARCFVETYFQMNFSTMQHRSIELIKHVDDTFVCRPELNQAAANQIRIHNLPMPGFGALQPNPNLQNQAAAATNPISQQQQFQHLQQRV